MVINLTKETTSRNTVNATCSYFKTSITNSTNEVCIASRIIHIHGHSTYNRSSETSGVFYICDDACLTTADVHDDVRAILDG